MKELSYVSPSSVGNNADAIAHLRKPQPMSREKTRMYFDFDVPFQEELVHNFGIYYQISSPRKVFRSARILPFPIESRTLKVEMISKKESRHSPSDILRVRVSHFERPSVHAEVVIFIFKNLCVSNAIPAFLSDVVHSQPYQSSALLHRLVHSLYPYNYSNVRAMASRLGATLSSSNS